MSGLYDKNLAKVRRLPEPKGWAFSRFLHDSWELNLQFSVVRVGGDGHTVLVQPHQCRFDDLLEIALRYNLTRDDKRNTLNLSHAR